MKPLLCVYIEQILSVTTGTIKGNTAVSKPLYILSIINAIEQGVLAENIIKFDTPFIKENFASLYERIYHNKKGHLISFFLRPFFHLGSSTFYHLIWDSKTTPVKNSHTPSAKFIREHLLYAKLDDELWDLLQDKESREQLKRNIIERYLIATNN